MKEQASWKRLDVRPDHHGTALCRKAVRAAFLHYTRSKAVKDVEWIPVAELELTHLEQLDKQVVWMKYNVTR